MSLVEPLHLILEFARAEKSDDAFAFRFTPQEYHLRSEGGAFASSRLGWDEHLLADLAAVRRPNRDPAIVQRLGEALRKFLAPTRWVLDEVRLRDAVKEQRRVMVTIRSAAAELYALPWELLTIESTGQHIGELSSVLVRYEWPDTHSIPGAAATPKGGRILIAWSTAGGAIPVTEHIAAIKRASQPGSGPFDAERDVIAHASGNRLKQALSAASEEQHHISILHLLCHGGEVGSSFGLALDSDGLGGGRVVVDAGRLRQWLAPYAATLRMVVLSACDSGNSGTMGNQLGSVAQALHRAGIAAVVASRYPLSVAGSIRLCETLYSGLLASTKSLESALLGVRQALAADPEQLDWASLQLYARLEDGDETRPISDRPLSALSTGEQERELMSQSELTMNIKGVPHSPTKDAVSRSALTTIPISELAEGEHYQLALSLLVRVGELAAQRGPVQISFSSRPGNTLNATIRISALTQQNLIRRLRHTVEMLDILDDKIAWLKQQQEGLAGAVIQYDREIRLKKERRQQEIATLIEILDFFVECIWPAKLQVNN